MSPRIKPEQQPDFSGGAAEYRNTGEATDPADRVLRVNVVRVKQAQPAEPRRNQHLADRQHHAIDDIGIDQHQNHQAGRPGGQHGGEQIGDPGKYRDRNQFEQQPGQGKG